MEHRAKSAGCADTYSYCIMRLREHVVNDQLQICYVKETHMSDITLILGYNASGKSTYTESYVTKGYTRLNRDELGGKLDSLPLLLEDLYKKGTRQFVLDNTYADIESRKSIIEFGKKLGLPVNCIWLDTSFENAQFNACQRMIRKVGRLLTPKR